MNIQEITKDNFKAFGGIKTKDSDKLDQINAVKYIQHLAETTATDISNWNLLEVFGDGQNMIGCMMNKQEINKRFFNEKSRKVTPSQILNKDQLKAIEDYGIKDINGEKQRIRNLINAHKAEASRYNSKCMNRLKAAYLESERLAALSGEDIVEKTKKDIERIVKAGFWEFHSVDKHMIIFKTSNEVVLEWNNKKCNFGKFYLVIENKNVLIKPASNNIKANGSYPHPHTQINGNVCWGNAIGPLNDAVTRDDLFGISQVCASLLSHYNHSNPFCDFMYYYSMRKSLERVSQFMNGMAYEQPVEIEVIESPYYLKGLKVYRDGEEADIILADLLKLRRAHNNNILYNDSSLKDIATWAYQNYHRIKEEKLGKQEPLF